MPLHEIRVFEDDADPRADALTRQVSHDDLDIKVASNRVFYLEGETDEGAERLAHELLTDPVTQRVEVKPRTNWDDVRQAEVSPLPGVTNTEMGSVRYGAALLGVEPEAVESGTEFRFGSATPSEVIQRVAGNYLVNKTINQIRTKAPETLVIAGQRGPIEMLPIRELSDEALVELSKDRKLALNLSEMKTIQHKARAMGREIRDAEAEYLAAAWSEHCCHKTTNAEIIVNGERQPSIFSRIKERL